MELLAHIIAYAVFAALILAGLGLIVGIWKYFYYRLYLSDRVKVYYDDTDHRKGYYIVKRPRGPYPVGYPRERIVSDMEEFERLKKEEKAKRHAAPRSGLTRPMWLQILLMTPAEYMQYRQRKKEK